MARLLCIVFSSGAFSKPVLRVRESRRKDLTPYRAMQPPPPLRPTKLGLYGTGNALFRVHALQGGGQAPLPALGNLSTYLVALRQENSELSKSNLPLRSCSF